MTNNKKKTKKTKFSRRKKTVTKGASRPPMSKFSVYLPSASVIRYIRIHTERSHRSELDLCGWLLEAAYTVAYQRPDLRLTPRRKWKLKKDPCSVKIPLAPMFERPLIEFIRQFCTNEHLMVGEVVTEMLLVALEAFKTLSGTATSDELREKIRKDYLR